MNTSPHRVDVPVSSGSKDKLIRRVLVGFSSLRAMWLDKGWGNPDQNVILETK